MENGWEFRLHATYDDTIRRDLAVFEKLAAAESLGQAAAESEQHRQWRVRRGMAPPTESAVFDPCFSL